MAETNPEHEALQREITELESLLREKRGAIEEGSVPEREAFRETFHEKFGESFASPPAQSTLTPPPAPADISEHHQAVAAAPEDETKLETLIGIALTKGVRVAADVARRASPWLMDELHDRLQDQYYDKLIQMKQLKAL